MLKKILISLVVVVLLIAAGLRLIGISVLHLDDVVDVASGLGAKIACSGKFVTGLTEQQIMDDLAGYSPATKLLDIQYQGNKVTADFMGLSLSSATFRGNLGCTLDSAQALVDLDKLSAADLKARSMSWPAGETVNSIEQTMQTLVDSILRQDNQDGLDTRALLVVKDGYIVAESYAQGFDYATPLLGWSMGKSLTSIMLGNLALKQRVKVNSKELFSQWQNDERSNISLENLLQMSSGLAFAETYIPGTDSTRMLFLEPSTSGYALAKPVEHPPGKHFAYSSGTTNILMRYVFETLGAQPQALVNYFHTEIAIPLGLANTVFELDSEGIYVGSSYIFSSARDWARMGWLMVNQGVINNQQLISKDWVKAATQSNQSENDGRYGYQFWLNTGGNQAPRWSDLPSDLYAMMGNKGQRVMMIPAKNAVIVRLGWSNSYPDSENFGKIITALSTAD